MILRRVCWSTFLCLALLLTVKAEVQIDEQGYQNLLISFAPNIPTENAKELIISVQELLEKTSSVLHTAIGIRIANATFLLPPTWTADTWEDFNITQATSEYTKKIPDINVDATESSPFGKQPVSLQYGGCGVSGHQITLPLEFISSTDGYPKEKLLAREWLKYRYGVFEENGFAGDSLYPDYYRIPGSSEIRIPECTNSEVTYTYKRPITGDDCDMNSAGDFGLCRTHVDKESAANVTSSLMYYHKDLPNIEHVCGKDGHSHHNTSRNKQNVLCNGQSIWDVIQQSKEFEKIPQEPSEPDSATIQFSYIQKSRPRFVVLLEDSDKLYEKAKSIRFALKRFYYDLAPKSKLGVYRYNREAFDILAYTELASEDRTDLGDIVDFGYTQKDICTSCGLNQAMQTLLKDNEDETGSILLITATSLDTPPEIPEKLKTAGICIHVLRVLDEAETADDTYDNLVNSLPCSSYEPMEHTSDELQNFRLLSSFLKKSAPEINDGFEIKTVAVESISAETPVTVVRDKTASSFTLWLGKAFNRDSIECSAGETKVKLTPGTKAANIASFTFEPMDEDVTCKLGSAKHEPILTEVQMTTQKGHYFVFDTWYHDESTDGKQLPIIVYAKIYYGGYPVKEASVRMYVTSENNSDVAVKMLDNGRGDPDITQFDGIYSGYFTDFITTDDYHITVKIDDNQGQAKIGKLSTSSRSDTCCGSKITSDDAEVPTFDMERYTKYSAKNKRPDDGYPPSRTVDLQAFLFNTSDSVVLTWTAPGGGKASSYEFYVFCDLEDCDSGKLPNWLILNQTEPKLTPKPHGEPEEAIFLFAPEILKFEELTLFFAIKSLREKGQLSELSNKAEVLLSFSAEPSTTVVIITKDDKNLAKSDSTGVIVGSTIIGVFILLCLGVVLYFNVIKPRRCAKSSDYLAREYSQDKNQNGTEISGSFRALSIRDRGPSIMRRVESFPVILYTHDQIKDYKKKVDPPLYRPAIAPRPWMSMNVLSNSELNRGGDSKSIGSASTLPMNDRHRSAEMKQLDDVSLSSETPRSEETIKF